MFTLSSINNWYIFGIALVNACFAGIDCDTFEDVIWISVLVASSLIYLLVYAAREDERTEGVKMSQYDYGVHNLCQWPTILAFC